MWDTWKLSPSWFTLWHIVASYMVDTYRSAKMTLQVFIPIVLLDLPEAWSNSTKLWSFPSVDEMTCRVLWNLCMHLFTTQVAVDIYVSVLTLCQWRLLKVLTELQIAEHLTWRCLDHVVQVPITPGWHRRAVVKPFSQEIFLKAFSCTGALVLHSE